MPGRWADARQPNRKELAATLVLSLPLVEWSVKVSDGPPEDAAEDLACRCGPASCRCTRSTASRRRRPTCGPALDVPGYVARLVASASHP